MSIMLAILSKFTVICINLFPMITKYSCNVANLYFSALSLTERALFRELIRQLDRKINPGLTKLTWNTDYVDSYIEDCFNETANVCLEPLTLSMCEIHVNSCNMYGTPRGKI